MLDRGKKAQIIRSLYGRRKYTQKQLAQLLSVSVKDIGSLTRDMNYTYTVEQASPHKPILLLSSYPFLDQISLSLLEQLEQQHNTF